MKRSKKYIAAAAKIDADRLYTPLEAVTLVRETSTTKYDATIDVALCLGVDPKKADQAIRSTVNPSSEMHSDQTDRSLVSPPWRRGATCAEGGGA